MRQGFDNDMYIRLQSERIRERIAQFGGKLYLEFGGKLFDDNHASRVLPGFQPDSKLRMLKTLADRAEVVIAVNAQDIESNKLRGDLGIGYDAETLRLIDSFREAGLYVGSVVITRFGGQAAEAYKRRLENQGIRVFRHYAIEGYPSNLNHIVSSDGYGRNYLLPRKLAREATSEALNAIEKSKAAQKHREDVKKAEAEATARALKGKVVQLSAKGGEGGKLYGSITAQEIAQALKVMGECGVKKAVALRPITSPNAILPYLEELDLVLVMTVEPGFGGQAFMESQLDTIRQVRALIERYNPACELEVDGGISPKTAPLVVEAGANVLVAGSAVYGKEDIPAAIAALRV